MILGTGIDIVEVARIAASFEQHGARFLDRVLLPAEMAYCLQHRQPALYIAARFAAKMELKQAGKMS